MKVSGSRPVKWQSNVVIGDKCVFCLCGVAATEGIRARLGGLADGGGCWVK